MIGNADAAIGDGKQNSEFVRPSCDGNGKDIQLNSAAMTRELDRIADQVEQQLTDTAVIGNKGAGNARINGGG